MRRKNEEFIKAIDSFITRYMDEYGVSPTQTEIAQGTGMSQSNVDRYLAYMRETGMIEYHGRRSVVNKETLGLHKDSIRVPVLGAVSCGIPKFAEENIEQYVRLPASVFGAGELFMLRANGDSMIEAGIHDGDLVLIRRQSFAEPGQIAVVLIDDEATLKRVYPEKDRIRLHPENRRMEDIYVDHCIIQGVAVKVIKDLE